MGNGELPTPPEILRLPFAVLPSGLRYPKTLTSRLSVVGGRRCNLSTVSRASCISACSMRDSSRRPLPENFGSRNFPPLPDAERGQRGDPPSGSGQQIISHNPRIPFRRRKKRFLQGVQKAEGEVVICAAPLCNPGPQRRPLAPPCAGEGRGHAVRGRGRGLRVRENDAFSPFRQLAPLESALMGRAAGGAGAVDRGRRRGVRMANGEWRILFALPNVGRKKTRRPRQPTGPSRRARRVC
jgi:hypothetical protein